MTSDPDVIVVGLGGMGSAAAYHLAARGVRVLGLEQFGPAHDRGSSHGGSRIIRQSYFEDPAYVPLLQRAYELWHALARDSGQEVITLTGGMMIGRPETKTVAGSRLSAERWGLPHEMLTAPEIRRRFPTFAPQPDEVALYERAAGLVRPEETVTAHLRLAERAGADLRFGQAVDHWEVLPGGRGVRVRAGGTVLTGGRLVVCPGAWAPEVLSGLGVPFTVERQVQYWFEPAGGTGPFRPDRHPIYVWESASPGEPEDTQVYGFPAIDGPGGGAKVAFFRRGSRCTPQDLDRTVQPEEVGAMAGHMATRIPDLPGRYLRAVACMYTNTPDEHFVIARHPDHDAVTVACGFSGHGFKFVPVVGEVLADLALDGATRHPIELFDPRRLTTAGT